MHVIRYTDYNSSRLIQSKQLREYRSVQSPVKKNRWRAENADRGFSSLQSQWKGKDRATPAPSLACRVVVSFSSRYYYTSYYFTTADLLLQWLAWRGLNERNEACADRRSKPPSLTSSSEYSSRKVIPPSTSTLVFESGGVDRRLDPTGVNLRLRSPADGCDPNVFICEPCAPYTEL